MEDLKRNVKDENNWETLKRAVERTEPMHEIRKTLELPRGAAQGNGAMLKIVGHRSCARCGLKEQTLEGKLSSCARCLQREVFEPPLYCSVECQRAAWPSHKPVCGVSSRPPECDGSWVDPYRAAKDGSYHFGSLELMDWEGEDEDGKLMGFGGVFLCEARGMRDQFAACGSDPAKFVKTRVTAFRWTCCGVDAGLGAEGCDHHGDPRATAPCGCDFCLAGKTLPSHVWNKKLRSQAARGLERALRRGPDPKSVCAAGLRNWELRQRSGIMRDVDFPDEDSDGPPPPKPPRRPKKAPAAPKPGIDYSKWDDIDSDSDA